MKLDRNNNPGGMGKYALIKLRNYPPSIRAIERARVDTALAILRDFKMLDYGNVGTESEFMVIRLKDRYAQEALWAYANEADKDDHEYAGEIIEMANRSGPDSPFCKRPD
jgi:hypothetical protein